MAVTTKELSIEQTTNTSEQNGTSPDTAQMIGHVLLFEGSDFNLGGMQPKRQEHSVVHLQTEGVFGLPDLSAS